MIIPQAITPSKIAKEDFKTLNWRRVAMREAVHAPVPGRGIATNAKSPKSSAFLTLTAFSFPRSMIFWKSHPILSILERWKRTVFANFIKKGTGLCQGIIMQYFTVEDDDADGIRNGGFGSTTK